MRSAPSCSGTRFCRPVIASARVRLPGPRHRSVSRPDHSRTWPRLPRSTPPPHHVEPVSRVEGADEDGGRVAVLLGHGVHQPVHAVIEIHVGKPRGAIQRLIARRGSSRSVAGRIVLTDIGFDLDDYARRRAIRSLVHQQHANEIAGDVERGAGIERWLQRRHANRRQESGVRSQESGVRRQEVRSGPREPKAHGPSLVRSASRVAVIERAKPAQARPGVTRPCEGGRWHVQPRARREGRCRHAPARAVPRRHCRR